MWQKGPLPPNTYNWGGVVPVGQESKYGGFYFADFKGNHVVLVGCTDTIEVEYQGQKVSATVEKILKADEVAYYNNSLELPPLLQGR